MPQAPQLRRPELVAAAVAALSFALGLLALTHVPDSGLGAAMFLIALLSIGRLPERGIVLGAALVASLATIAPRVWHWYSADMPLVHVDTVIWCAMYWMAAASLTWDPRRRQVGIRQLADAFAHAPAPMALADRGGTILDANDAFTTLIGVERTRLLNTPLFDLLGAMLWENLRAERTQLVRGQLEHIQFEREFTLPDGRAIWASVYSRVVRDTSGRPAFIVIQVLDLSEQRRAQHALAVSESRFRGIIENTGELTMVIGLDGRISYANPKAYDVFGVRATALVGARPLPLIHSSDRNEFGRTFVRSQHRPRETFRLRRVRLEGAEDTFLDVQMTGLGETPGISGTVVTGRVTTEQVRTEKQLRNSESKFSTVFHSSPDAILILRNTDSVIVDFNTSFTRLLGYTREDAIGRPEPSLAIWSNAQDRTRVQAALERHHECLDYETQLVAKNGEIMHTEISLRYVELDGELCVLCIGRDITKRREAEAAAKDSEEKFARIFSASPDGIVIIGLDDGRILDINDAFLKASGFEVDELVGHQLGKLPIFADQSQLKVATQRVMSAGSYSNMEFSFLTKSGENIPALVSATVVELEGRRSLICIAKDNRTQRETEEKLKRSEARFRGTFENAPIGMLLVATDGQIFQANRFALELLEYSESDLIDAHISRLVPNEERRLLKDELGRMLHHDKSVSHSERRLVSNTGAEIWTNFHVVMLRSASGEPLYYIVQIADITDLKQGQAMMERMAFYDTLTDLANRRLFGNRLEQAIQHAIRTKRHAALLYLDLDQFKRVNDTLGHEAGDELLKEVAYRLSHCVRNEDTVARPGGDEFTILLYDIASPADAGIVAEKILERLRLPISISGHQLVVTTSIGITVIPEDSAQPNVLTKNADLAMYRAKEHGGNNYQYYSEDMNTEAQERLKTENELRQALKRNEFELYFQPKVRLADNRIVGVEALIRWHHPERGLLPPDQFINIAEETGVIVGIGSWAIEAACSTVQDLSRATATPLQVGVNLSARQFKDPELIRTIRRCIRESGLAANQLEIEITESMLIDDRETAQYTVERLRELGVRIAIDDFGTGYSALHYLKRLPIDTIKIDRSFVMEIPNNDEDVAITTAIIAMAHRLNLEVVAEGIETVEQLGFLRDQQCEFGQGYLFSRPIPARELRKFLDPNVTLMRPRGRSTQR